ncbi:MAG: efflux RND transporter periplasmic adaptor subunit [Desulfobacterales bacterium]
MPEAKPETLRIPPPGAGEGFRRKRRKRLAGAGVAFLAALGAGLYLLGFLRPAVAVRTTLVQEVLPSQALTLLSASGYVVADRKSAVASRLTGRLVELSVEEGSRLRRGEVIARLDRREAEAACERARRQLEAEMRRRDQLEAELTEAERDYGRKRALGARGTIAQGTLDQAEARFRALSAAVEASSASILAARAALREAEIVLEDTVIRAPFDAVVLTKNAEVGDILTPLAATADAKAAVVTIADLAALRVEVDVSESQIARVREGQSCEIRLDAYPETRFPGRVHRILPTADRSKAAVTVKVDFLARDERVLPEMSARVAFLSREPTPEEQAPRTAAPAAAVVSRGGRELVFRVERDRARESAVRTGKRFGDWVELLEGPPPGTRLVLSPPARLADGARLAPSAP